MVKQVLLDGKATRISSKAAVMPDDTVAGNNDGNRVAVVGHAHSATGVGLADHDGHIFVAARFSGWNGL